MLVANIKIWKSHLNIREGSDYYNVCNSMHSFFIVCASFYSSKIIFNLHFLYSPHQKYNTKVIFCIVLLMR